jgi:hypothetical protein
MALFLVALTVRICLIFVVGSYRQNEVTEVNNIARSLAISGGFADAYGPGSGPTAHAAPVYPFLLSSVFRVLGTGRAGEIGQEIFSSAIASITCALLPALAVAFGFPARVGWCAGFWAALFPINFYPETKGAFEGALVALSLVLICLYFACVWTRGRLSALEAVVGGMLAGIGTLVSPTVGAVAFLMLVIGGWVLRDKLRAYTRYAAAFAAVAIVSLIPWTLRNERALGSPIVARSNLGLELMLSNNDRAEADYFKNFANGVISQYHPFLNPVVRAAEIREGEVAFQRARMKEAEAWIATHPRRFAELTAARIAWFWFPSMARSVQTVYLRLEVLLGFTGYVLLLLSRNRCLWLIAALWLGYPLIYYFVQSYSRYRYPVEWSFLFLGSYAIWRLYIRWAGTNA